MKNIFKAIGAASLLVALFSSLYAANTCTRTDFQCYTAANQTMFRVDASGNMTGTLTNSVLTTALSMGTTTQGVSNATTAANTALSVPVQVSTAITQGMVVIATTLNGTYPTLVNGVMSASNAATTILGVADTSASSGTVVNVNFSGVAVVLATGTVSVGDLLVSTSTVPGYVAANNSGAAGAIVGTALTSQVATAPGLIRVLLRH